MLSAVLMSVIAMNVIRLSVVIPRGIILKVIIPSDISPWAVKLSNVPTFVYSIDPIST